MLFLQQQQSLMLISVNMTHTSGLMAAPESVCYNSQQQVCLGILRPKPKLVCTFINSYYINNIWCAYICTQSKFVTSRTRQIMASEFLHV